MIYRNYFCSNDEKKEFDKQLLKNEERYQKELREKYNPAKIFDGNLNKKISDEKALIEYKEAKWYQKVLNKILKWFKEFKY